MIPARVISTRVIPPLVGVLVAAVSVAGCSAPSQPAQVDAQAEPSASGAANPSPTQRPGTARTPQTPSPTPSSSTGPVSSATPTPTATPTPIPTPSTHPTDSPKAGKATGPVTDTPFEVNGIPIVSKDHRLSASYVPPWADQPHGLHPDATAGFKKLQAAARADGLRFSIRSGYRSFATQKGSFNRAMQQYNEKTARLYFAEAGASEHQLGLALDAWDGKNRGTAFARTKHAQWLADHAHEHGFIVRYPQDKTHITGYAWESWHLRWVGPETSQHFTPGSGLTLEEYLGIA
ncbi:MAG: M15 family metallopeptidase [Propionibacteriaceae bacterium]|nr:M15 family metallopeptidase [Propionibacteriaceae bacterium]